MYTVIGGSGFIGTRLCELLEKSGRPFEIIDLRPSRRFPEKTKIADIRDLDALSENVTGTVLINLAAVHRDDVRDRSLYYTTNVDGARNLCSLASARGIEKIVFTSTVAVYGFAEPESDEETRTNPFNDYGQSKLEAEGVLTNWFDESPARNLVILRPTVVFGEGNRGNVYNLLNQIASGKFVMVGNGRNRKSMAYVENVAAYLLHAAEDLRGKKTVNYVDKPDFTMNALVHQVRKTLHGKAGVGPRIPYPLGLGLGYLADGITRISGKTLPVSSIRVRKFCATTSFDSAIRNESGFVAPFTLEGGLARTLKSEFLEPDPDREIFYTE